MWLRRGAEEQMQLDFALFVFIFTVEVVGVFDYFDGFPNDVGRVNGSPMNIHIIPTSLWKPLELSTTPITFNCEDV
jgi:hypothetical protein